VKKGQKAGPKVLNSSQKGKANECGREYEQKQKLLRTGKKGKEDREGVRVCLAGGV